MTEYIYLFKLENGKYIKYSGICLSEARSDLVRLKNIDPKSIKEIFRKVEEIKLF